ncbi:MarR family winged helix-turn-helix transcriptional regulator [Leucobacter komagatae]|uniref:MarR family winged helix-turn-helix transcriptional regulator n=1 Tax=Leucobacter komagatae TaxID=55969 RepID=UPI0012EE725D|nr:MarR family transcriptional regulator [Leucobacter komagatae]
MLPQMDPESDAVKPCATIDDPVTADLTWLMQRATRVLSDDFDELARNEGLSDLRDCLVLAVVGDGAERTQLEISRSLGIDKTTLVAILDRLEKQGLLTREHLLTDRRVRIPSITPTGTAVLDRVMEARDRAVADRLNALPADEGAVLRTALWRIATAASS